MKSYQVAISEEERSMLRSLLWAHGNVLDLQGWCSDGHYEAVKTAKRVVERLKEKLDSPKVHAHTVEVCATCGDDGWECPVCGGTSGDKL